MMRSYVVQRTIVFVSWKSCMREDIEFYTSDLKFSFYVTHGTTERATNRPSMNVAVTYPLQCIKTSHSS